MVASRATAFESLVKESAKLWSALAMFLYFTGVHLTGTVHLGGPEDPLSIKKLQA
jgi:hypothetical protein